MPNMTPDYEVRLQLDPARVLSPEHELAPAVLKSFNVSETVRMNVQFLDKCSKDIYDAGWCVRIRKVEGKSDHELTYKKRYDIENENIGDALTQAKKDGFHGGDSKYEAQVEWGYAKQTLSISREEKISYSGKTELDLPDTVDSRAMATKEAPGKFDNWGPGHKWGTKALETARIFGPVLAKRWIGAWNEVSVFVEVWPLLNSAGTGIEYIVEASFKTDSYATASAERRNLANDLQTRGWLLPGDSLKTKLILERYSCLDMPSKADEEEYRAAFK